MNAAVTKPSYILIDEPETNLHPSLQLDFLTTLGSYSQYGVIFATHSIGLARAITPNIYAFPKHEGRCITQPFQQASSLAEFLGELSYSSYRALGFEKVLLVEGTTEVTAIQQFLRLLGKDHKIVLLPLGGAQMINERSATQLSEVKRICESVCALIDSERNTARERLDPARVGFVQNCKRLGISCHVLKRRALENYFSDDAVKREKGGKYRALEPYERLRDLPNGWAKSDNWRIARAMSWADLSATDLGRFLESL